MRFEPLRQYIDLRRRLPRNGFAPGNAMNKGQTLAVYATPCRHSGQPFVFPGSAAQWNGLTDMTKIREAGFLDYRSTPDAFFDLFERLKAERLIPG